MKQPCTVCNTPLKNKKSTFICRTCGRAFCGKHIYFYVDENNGAITKNSPERCKECWIKMGQKRSLGW